MDTKLTHALLLPSLVGILFTGALAGEVPFPVAPLAKNNYLLIDKAEIDAAKRKAESHWSPRANSIALKSSSLIVLSYSPFSLRS